MHADPDLSDLLSHGLRRGLTALEVEALCTLLVRTGVDAAEVAALELALRELSRAAPEAALPAGFLDAVEAAIEARADVDAQPGTPQLPGATILRFARRLTGDPVLVRRIQQAAGREARLDLCVQAGTDAGFRFSRADLEGLLAQAEPANDGSLTDEQLEAVAGGANPELAFLDRLLKG